MSLTLDAGGVAELLSYRCRDGRPNAAAIRKLARAGKIPGPIATIRQTSSADVLAAPASLPADAGALSPAALDSRLPGPEACLHTLAPRSGLVLTDAPFPPVADIGDTPGQDPRPCPGTPLAAGSPQPTATTRPVERASSTATLPVGSGRTVAR
jgi:hypothetical protein